MRYITFREGFYAACDAMALLYKRYPTITPAIEEQIEGDLIEYLEAHGAVYESGHISNERDLIVVDPQIIAPLMLQDIKLQDIKEELQHA